VAVQKAIKRAIDGIETINPVIGDHLRQSIGTGRRCCYQPIP